MRLAYVTLPLGTLLAAGGIWLMAATPRPAPAITSSSSADIEPVHPVTSQMVKETAAWTAKTAPNFSLPDSTGRKWTLGSLSRGKPLFLYFIIDGCPCSDGAEPHFQRLYQKFRGKVNFAAVIWANPKAAGAWAKKHGTPYPVLADASLLAIHAFGARHSVYNALVLPTGVVDKMWPGYSLDLLQDINLHLSAAADIPIEPLAVKDAPLKMTSGCFFPSEG